jgi:hypothetical protein
MPISEGGLLPRNGTGKETGMTRSKSNAIKQIRAHDDVRG